MILRLSAAAGGYCAGFERVESHALAVGCWMLAVGYCRWKKEKARLDGIGGL